MNTKTEQATGEGNAPRCISINIHRLGGDESGFEASTRRIKNGLGLYFCNSGDSREEAMHNLASDIASHWYCDVGAIYDSFEVEFEG